MKTTRSVWRGALVATILATMPMELAAQEDVLNNISPNVRALRTLREPLQMFSLGPFDNPVMQMTSPDSQALQMLDEAASSAASELRAAIDLLAVYENLQCDTDRAILKPLLDDRLRLYSRLLGFDVEKASFPLNTPNAVKEQATSKKALKLHDDLVAAKNKLGEIAVSFR